MLSKTIEIDVYGDAACTQVISSVGWGEIEARSSKTRAHEKF